MGARTARMPSHPPSSSSVTTITNNNNAIPLPSSAPAPSTTAKVTPRAGTTPHLPCSFVPETQTNDIPACIKDNSVGVNEHTSRFRARVEEIVDETLTAVAKPMLANEEKLAADSADAANATDTIDTANAGGDDLSTGGEEEGNLTPSSTDCELNSESNSRSKWDEDQGELGDEQAVNDLPPAKQDEDASEVPDFTELAHTLTALTTLLATTSTTHSSETSARHTALLSHLTTLSLSLNDKFTTLSARLDTLAKRLQPALFGMEDRLEARITTLLKENQSMVQLFERLGDRLEARITTLLQKLDKQAAPPAPQPSPLSEFWRLILTKGIKEGLVFVIVSVLVALVSVVLIVACNVRWMRTGRGL